MVKAEILIETDLTPSSEGAIEVGINWAQVLNCVPTIVHVAHLDLNWNTLQLISPKNAVDYENFLQAYKVEVGQKLDHLLAGHKVKLKLETLIEFGDAAKILAKRSIERNSKLIVLPAFNEKQRVKLYGTAEKIIRLTNCPVLVVKNKECLDPKKVIWGYALDSTSESPSIWAYLVATYFKAHITMVHSLHRNQIGAITKDFNLETLRDFLNRSEINKDEIKRLNRHLEFFEKEGLRVDFKVLKNNDKKIKQVLNQYIQENSADLLIVGTKALSGPSKFYLGSVAENLLRSNETSILIVKSNKGS